VNDFGFDYPNILLVKISCNKDFCVSSLLGHQPHMAGLLLPLLLLLIFTFGILNFPITAFLIFPICTIAFTNLSRCSQVVSLQNGGHCGGYSYTLVSADKT